MLLTICSVIDDEDLLRILKLPILVVLDEAYIEFSGIESKMKWVKKHENLIVLRTFSKRAGIYIYFNAFSLESIILELACHPKLFCCGSINLVIELLIQDLLPSAV